MSETNFTIEIDLRNGYEFEVRFDREGMGTVTVDEPPPLGAGAGPNPARLLAAAVGTCMSASLRYCLEKARIDLDALRTSVDATIVRNERGRLRIGSLNVRLAPGIAVADRERIGRCLEIFEDFCIVGQSVRQGIPVQVEVAPAVGERSSATAEPVAAV